VTLLIFAVLYVVNYLSSVLLPFFIAWLLAYLVYPVVRFVQYKLHVKVRAIAIIITLILLILVIGGIVYLIIPPMIEQFQKLGDVATRYLHQTTHTNNIGAVIQQWLQNNQKESGPILPEQRLLRRGEDSHAKGVLSARTDGKHSDEHHSIIHHIIIYVLHTARL
jgi:predicted PurR-regulated permease PerM